MALEIHSALNRIWWGIVLRGILALALGVFILIRPLESVAVFALLIAVWALFDGVAGIVHAFDARPLVSHWWVMLMGGIVSTLFGIAALFFYPILSLTFAVLWVSWWLTVTGFVGMYAAFQSRQAKLPWGWPMAFGVLSVAAGVFALLSPPSTLVAIMSLISTFAIIGGVVLLIGAIRMKALEHRLKTAL